MSEAICYNCKHRGNVENSRHSCCKHPRTKDIVSNSGELQLLMKGIIVNQRIPWLYNDLQLVTEPSGLEEGWFMWPFNFDPIWLRSCSGFEEKIKIGVGG